MSKKSILSALFPSVSKSIIVFEPFFSSDADKLTILPPIRAFAAPTAFAEKYADITDERPPKYVSESKKVILFLNVKNIIVL